MDESSNRREYGAPKEDSAPCKSVLGRILTVRITSKGQVTIPIELREQVGLLPGTEIDFAIDGDGVRITRAERSTGRGQTIVERLRGRATSGLSTEEIMALTRD